MFGACAHLDFQAMPPRPATDSKFNSGPPKTPKSYRVSKQASGSSSDSEFNKRPANFSTSTPQPLAVVSTMPAKAPKTLPSSKASKPPLRRVSFPVSVKVENLSKATTKKALESRLSWIGPLDVCLLECGSEPANHAYVNCQDRSSAKKVVNKLDNNILDGNLLRAKLKSSLNPNATVVQGVSELSQAKKCCAESPRVREDGYITLRGVPDTVKEVEITSVKLVL